MYVQSTVLPHSEGGGLSVDGTQYCTPYSMGAFRLDISIVCFFIFQGSTPTASYGTVLYGVRSTHTVQSYVLIKSNSLVTGIRKK